MLKMGNAVLVIVDVQGRLATLMHNRENLFANLVKITKGCRALDIPILWNEQLPDKLGETIPELKDILSDLEPMAKSSFSCCGNSVFINRLKEIGRKQVLLVGIETHICVYQTAIDLINNGYEVHLVTDAVSSRFEDNYRIGIDRIKDAGGVLTTVEMALFELLKVAEGDKFKEIIKIIK